jgi:TetR/AcrR family transcriptional repressor of nem operon
MPPSENSDKRSRLIQSALALVYKRGFAETRLIDIAAEANVPAGNVYYYFKTKEEIGAAIIDERLSQIKTLQEKLGRMDSAQERLCAFVNMTFDNRAMLARGGCPAGSLCTELHKEGGRLADRSTVLFEQLLEWLEVQFQALGQAHDAHGLAVHLLSALQGIAVLAHSLNDPDIVVLEAERLQRWICTLQMKPAEE